MKRDRVQVILEIVVAVRHRHREPLGRVGRERVAEMIRLVVGEVVATVVDENQIDVAFEPASQRQETHALDALGVVAASSSGLGCSLKTCARIDRVKPSRVRLIGDGKVELELVQPLVPRDPIERERASPEPSGVAEHFAQRRAHRLAPRLDLVAVFARASAR